MAPYLLQWKMMQYAKKNNCETYDFLGIAPETENGGFVKTHPYAGITEFKLKFGGYRKTYYPGREFVLNSFWHPVYRSMKKIRENFKKMFFKK